MERKKHSARPSLPKQSSDKRKSTTEGFLVRVHRPTTFSLRALLLSFFSCSGSGVDCGDDPVTYSDNSNKGLVVSPTRPLNATKRRQARHAASETPQVQHESTIALSKSLKKLEAEDNGKDWQIITASDFIDNKKQDIAKQETPLPSISEPSTILSESLRSLLYTHLPTLVRGREWVLLYSTWKHGISLRTLYRRSAHFSGSCLLVVEDSKGAAFGGLLTGPLNPVAKPKYQGTHDSFVFTNVATDFGLFRPTGSNRYYFLCTHDMLAFGGGTAFALRLDEDLMHGSSGLSETFGNCCLSCTEEFNIKHVELWGFAHTSKCLWC
eukprot:c19651_g1_i2 orf=481-1452(-)